MIKRIFPLLIFILTFTIIAGCTDSSIQKIDSQNSKVTENVSPLLTTPTIGISTSAIITPKITITPILKLSTPTVKRTTTPICDNATLAASPYFACCNGEIYDKRVQSCCHGNVLFGEWSEKSPYKQCGCDVVICYGGAGSKQCCYKAPTDCYCL
jgi:hypothetical protein